MTAANEALDDYLIWELCKQRGIKARILEPSPNNGNIQELIEEVRQDYRANAYGRKEKLELLQDLDSNPRHRFNIFKDCSWRKETVRIAELGTTLPRVGDLPPEVITGTLSDVTRFVQHADPEEYRSVEYIMSLKDVPAVLDAFRPWVVTPGDIIRQGERMIDVHGTKDWNITETWGALNDGNHRTIAKIVANTPEEIECYVGHSSRHVGAAATVQ